MVLFANSLPSPFKRDLVVAGVGLHPTLIIVGALVENFLAHDWGAENLADKVNHLLRPGEPVQVAVDDDAVETVIYKNEKIAKELSESLHRFHSTRIGKTRGTEND